MKITKNENRIINESTPIDALKSTRGGFEISFKTADIIRSFWIMNDGQIAEYSKLLSRLSQFDYHFVSTSFSDWLLKTLRISHISESQKQNVKLGSDEDIKIYLGIDDIKLRLFFDALPKIVNDRTMVPIRIIAEALGATVDWNGENQVVSLHQAHSLMLSIGDRTPAFHPFSDSVLLDVAPFIENGRTYVPLRFIAEFFSKCVTYDETDNSVFISDAVYNGWYEDTALNYKTEIFPNYTFEGRSGTTMLNHYIEPAMFTIPFDDEDGLTVPSKSVISTGKIPESIATLKEIFIQYKKENMSIETYSENEFLVSYTYNEHDIFDEISSNEYYTYNLISYTRDIQRSVVYYFRAVDDNNTLYAKIDCKLDYYQLNKADIIGNLKTIQAR